MAKKMCHKYARGSDQDISCMKWKGEKCPSNTNSKCEIVAKPKYKRVKAWAWIREGKVWDACVRKWSTTKKLIPCTIIIETKYLKGAK